MKIGYLGAGAWGFALTTLLASKGHEIVSWTVLPDLKEKLENGEEHPKLPGHRLPKNTRITTNLEEALDGIDLLVESVTSTGLRPVFEEIKKIGVPDCPIALTSKGIEQDTGLPLPEVVVRVIGGEHRNQVGLITGPSFASEVVALLPTSVSCAAFSEETITALCDAFVTETFRVYPNPDIQGVCFGGSLKNIIAIACGIAEGLKLGHSARAALVTRGLHEISKLAISEGADPKTLYGLSGLGDVVLTCSSRTSRNFHLGILLAEGKSLEEAKEKIGMAVEGAYTAKSAHQLSRKLDIPMPITEAVYRVLYEGLPPKEAVKSLMTRSIKGEMD